MSRTASFEVLEARQLLHRGPAPWRWLEFLALAGGTAHVTPSQPAGTGRLESAAHGAGVGPLRFGFAPRFQPRWASGPGLAAMVQRWEALRHGPAFGLFARGLARVAASHGPGAASVVIPGGGPATSVATASPATSPDTGGSDPASGTGNTPGGSAGATGSGPPASGSQPGTISAAATTTVTIKATTRNASEAWASQGNGAGDGVFTVYASPAPTSSITLTVGVGGTASPTPNVDYTLSGSGLTIYGASGGGVTGTLTIPAGTSQVTITVHPLDPGDDATVQAPSETVILGLSGSSSSTGGGGYTVGSPSSATVTIAEVPTPQVQCTCPCGCTPNLMASTDKSTGGDPADMATLGSGVGAAAGSVVARDPGPLSDGFGTLFGQAQAWTNQTGYASNGSSGNGVVLSSLPSLQPTPNGGVMAIDGANAAIWFDPGTSSGTYVAKYFNQETLQPDGSSGDFLLTDTSGDRLRFYGFEAGLPQLQRGTLKSFTDPGGNTLTVTSHTALGQVAEVQRSATVGGVTTVESFLYTYVASGDNANLLQNVTLRRQVGGGSWTTVRQDVYTYYDGTQPGGNPGDLQTEQVEDPAGHVLDITYYRYYTDDSSPGFTDGLKYYFTPQSYARMAAALGNPLTATDAQVAPYADDYYEYDSFHRVTKATVAGAGDGTNGQGTYTYSYSTSANANGYNSWQTRTVETAPDGNQDTVYTNYAGEVMLRVVSDGSDPANPALQGKQWLTFDKYDAQGRLVEEAEPAAVTGYSDTYADLLNFQNGTSTYLSNSSGVIHLHDYGASTTATSTTPGDVLGYAKDEKIQVGQSGAPILLSSTQYIAHSNGGATVYPVASQAAYRNSDGTGAETTGYSYTWFANTDLPQSVTVTAPTISSAENGPGTADTVATYYDTYGRPIWTKDGDGYLDYTAYDNATGAVTETIADVDTTKTGEFSNLPAGWTTPAGGGLNLIDQVQVDGLGRTTKETDPNGNVTYTVYDDPNHAVRTYRGWNATTGTTTGPTEVAREDRSGGYVETLTMSATPAVSGSAGSYIPTGAEAIGSIQSLSRDYDDLGGRLIESDGYTNLSGVTYSTSPHIGTAGTNYDATIYGYDDSGNRQRVQDAAGTITDTLYDGLGRPTSVYVGTNDSTTDGLPWTPGNASASSNMVLVGQSQYDGNGVGDGDLTQTTLYPDGNSADNRVTQHAYDGRDRLVASKSGVQATEDTSTHRPIYYYDLDNLGEVTAVLHYDGDGVTLTGTKPSAALLRAYAVTSYDEQGRPYRTQQYDVNQSTGALSTSALTTNLYYDHRGDLIAESDPGGLWTKDQYDGAGRLTSESQTDGGGGTTWAAAGALTGDQVLTQTLTTYDGDGNPILVATKDRFHDDTSTDTGPLGNPATGPKARVYYAASYYDAADRLTATVDVGTNGGSAYTRPGTVPASSDTTLVTSYAYNPAGLVQTVTDPRGIQTQTSYDMLGEVTQTIDGYNAAISGGNPTASNNQTTNYTYDGVGHVLTVTAVMPTGTPNQVTGYVYGVTTAGGSGVNSNDLLATLEYPDPSTGSPSTSASNQEAYKYNAVGDATTFTDPDGTTHAYTYDVLGRETGDAVTTLGSGVDGTVLRLTTAYDTGDRPYLYTSYNAAGGGSVVNQVEDVYDGLGQLAGEYQEHGGAVNTSTSPEVQYAYTEMSGGQDNSRPTQMTYPNGRKIDYVYNAGLDSSISRLSALADDNNGTPGTTLEGYSYLGLDTIVQRSHPEPNINLTYIQQAGESNVITDGGDQYTGLDRFGRVVDQVWWNPTTQAATDRFQYGYDRADEVLYKNNLVNAAQSELYHANSAASGDNNTAYDALGRQAGFARGTLSSSGHNGTGLDTVASPSRSQSWSLDAPGNWSGATTNGSTTSRTFNAQDQTVTVSGGTAPSYDHDGNTTADNGQAFVYDAWNRLVAAKSGGATVATYAYDALGRRVIETYGGTTNHLYYSPQWQVIEERQNGTGASNVSQQYVWGAGYVDDLVLRDSYSGGVRTQRLYAQQDANFDVTALINTSGQVQERYLYDPYGSATVTDAGYVPRSGNVSSFGWRYLFQGGRLDAQTGWYGFRNRDLIASEGRWAERDPLGLSGGDLDLYRVEGDGPTGAVDPLGLSGGRWFNDDWTDWVNPLAWSAYAGDAFGSTGVGGAVTQEAEGLVVGMGRGLAAQAKEAASILDLPGNVRGLRDSLRRTPGDAGKIGALLGDPYGYLSQRAQVVGDAVCAQLSTAEGRGEALSYGVTAAAGTAARQVGPRVAAAAPNLAARAGAAARFANRPFGPRPAVPAQAPTSCPAPRTPTKLGDYRPYIRKSVRAEVEARAPRTADGRFIDPNTGQPINGTPDLGHKPGHEFWREKVKAEAEGLTQAEFNDRMNNPDLYQLENPSTNRGHRFEKPR